MNSNHFVSRHPRPFRPALWILLAKYGVWSECAVESGEVASAGVVEGSAVPPGVEADQVEGDSGVDMLKMGLPRPAVAGPAVAGDRYSLAGGALDTRPQRILRPLV